MYRPATNNTPEADFRLRDGKSMKLEGLSRTNNGEQFYQELIDGTEKELGLKKILEDWIGDERLTLDVRLKSISTPSQRGLRDLFNVIMEANKKVKDTNKVDVYWHWMADDLG